MRTFVLYALFALFVAGCGRAPNPAKHYGDLGESCRPDGSCSGALVCIRYEESIVAFRCGPPPVFESVMFCATCSSHCGDAGIKECQFSDTSVWGSKPAVCNCKP